MSTRLQSIVVFLLPLSSAFGQKPSVADLTIRSRAILILRCAECHGAKKERSDLNLLNHTQVVQARSVPFVRPKEPTASQLLELVQEGSMPPGRHEKVPAEEVKILQEWIAAGADKYPVRFDDLFAHETILADVDQAAANEVPSYRYLTLHHLAADQLPAADLSKARANFLAAMKTLMKDDAPLPFAIDTTATVFRIDLGKAGWDHKPFDRFNSAGKKEGIADASLFDVVLLEYPFGVFPVGFKDAEKFGERFLRPAGQVRPFAFVRGDWFVEAATTTPLANDLRDLMKLVAQVPPGLEAAKLTKAPKPIASPVPALDARYGLDPDGDSTVKGLKVETVHFSENKPRDKFKPDERFRLRISAEQPMFYQYVWVNSAGVEIYSKVHQYTPSADPDTYVLPKEGGLGDEPGFEKIMVFASRTEFAKGEIWRSRHQTKAIERFYHPFFALKKQGNGSIPETADAAITRRTATIEIVVPKKNK